jgi:hypothetical protein
MSGGTPVADLGNAASAIGSLSGIAEATLRGTGSAVRCSPSTKRQTMSSPARLVRTFTSSNPARPI